MHSMTSVTSIPDTFYWLVSRITKLYAGTKSAQFSPVLHNKMQKLLIISKHMLYMIPRSVYNRDDVNMHIACIHQMKVVIQKYPSPFVSEWCSYDASLFLGPLDSAPLH